MWHINAPIYELAPGNWLQPITAMNRLRIKNFLNAVVEVKGIIEEVQVSSLDAIVILSMQPTGGGVSCRFSPASKLDAAKFKNGMEVMIKGRCAGFNMDVNLVDCEIIL